MRISRKFSLWVAGIVMVIEFILCAVTWTTEWHDAALATASMILLGPTLVCFFWPKKPTRITATTFVSAPAQRVMEDEHGRG